MLSFRGRPNRRRRHLEGRTAFSSARTGRCKAGFGSFGDQVALEFRNTQGRHSFVMPEAVVKGELRPLRNPADDPD